MSCPRQDRLPGYYPVETLPSPWENRQGDYSKDPKRLAIYNRRTHISYPQEPLLMTSLKFLGLALLVLPLYILCYTAFHALRMVSASLRHLSLKVLLMQGWKLARIPFFFVQMECAALYGICKPLEGKALFASLESRLHDGKTRRQAVQYHKEQLSLDSLIATALLARENERSLFVGYCMQPYTHHRN